MTRTLFKKLRDTAVRFRHAREGNVAMIFAIVSVPLIVATGGLVDYSRIWAVQSQLQDAADVTSTMLSKDATKLTSAQLQTQGEAFFKANFDTNDTSNLVIKASYDSSGPSVTVKATTKVNTYFLPLVGVNNVNLSESSTAVWGEAHLRVALVLDNTGSMDDDGKMTALKTATKNLLTQLQAAATHAGDVYVSIIPFSKDVNVDSANKNATWLRWDLWEETNGSCSSGGWGWGGGGSYNTKTACQNAGRTWTPASRTTWNGCVTDRDQNYDVANTAPSGSNAKLFPPEQYSYCPVSMMGLSYDWNKLNSKITSMTPNGNTNQPIGLAWGWQSLTQSPFTIPAYDPAYQYKKIIILLTDGMNTENRWWTYSSWIDGREATLCDAIKKDNIILYTIQVNTGHDPTSQMLKDCATDTAKTFLLTSANQIVTTFQTIGTELSELRISR